MMPLQKALLPLVLATASLSAYAQSPTEHTQHHPKIVAADTQSSAQINPATVSKEKSEQTNAMDQQLQRMQAMREKMANAKTPEARQALMAEHMKVMREGMAMMGNSTMMGKGGKMGMSGMMRKPGTNSPDDIAQRQEMMEHRMQHMQSMMQMMGGNMMGMDGMQGPGGSPRVDMMEKRMQMMQSMMQMMLDRIESTPEK
ncbi:MAG: hypothetical protein WBD34_12345 [Burkholderiaceae bacterium]